MNAVCEVQVPCPECDTPLTIPVHAHTDGRSDNGVVQVDVVPDKTEIELHALLCGR